jgi:hypothetical protein
MVWELTKDYLPELRKWCLNEKAIQTQCLILNAELREDTIPEGKFVCGQTLNS